MSTSLSWRAEQHLLAILNVTRQARDKLSADQYEAVISQVRRVGAAALRKLRAEHEQSGSGTAVVDLADFRRRRLPSRKRGSAA